ncbi:MAG: tetratricopeptide repeat protein, partial [Sulfobacillus sp.]
ITKSAEAGDADAMRSLARAYRDGTGTPADPGQYFAWMKKAAEAGDAAGMFGLAHAYRQGTGAAVDLDQYSEWIRKAADAGHADAAMLHYINRILDECKIKTTELLDTLLGLHHAAEAIKTDHIPKEQNEGVAHFTRFQTLEQMLPVRSGDSPMNHLRLYNVEYLNDPHEGCRLFQGMKDSEKYPVIYSRLFDKLDKDPFISLLHKDLSIYVCSFTLRSDRLDLWRAYGRDGEGVCIFIPLEVFGRSANFHALGEHLKDARKPAGISGESHPSANTSVMKDGPQNTTQSVPRVLYLVRYEDTEIDKTLDRLHPHLNRIAALVTEPHGQEAEALRKCTVALLSDILFLYKNQEYKNEQEARLVFAASIGHPMLELDDQAPGKLFVKTDNFLFKHANSRIIIGPRVREKKAVELNLKFRLTKHGFSTTKVEQSQIFYR